MSKPEPPIYTGKRLKDHPGDMIYLVCPKCGRRGQYRKATLLQRYGDDVRMPGLPKVIADCGRTSYADYCQAHYDLDREG